MHDLILKRYKSLVENNYPIFVNFKPLIHQLPGQTETLRVNINTALKSFNVLLTSPAPYFQYSTLNDFKSPCGIYAIFLHVLRISDFGLPIITLLTSLFVYLKLLGPIVIKFYARF